jgi:hypothetical protein
MRRLLICVLGLCLLRVNLTQSARTALAHALAAGSTVQARLAILATQAALCCVETSYLYAARF